MRFHGLMLVRDEADIIAQNLRHVLQWADTLTIFDTGSTDGTWEVINEFAKKDSKIKALEHRPVVYGNPLRAYLFDRVRSTFEEGDWVVKVDADEFFRVRPREFVSNYLRESESCVWLQWYFFRLTSREVENYESGDVDLEVDRQRPIEDRRRFYKIPRHSEPRMFRYRHQMRWSAGSSFPHHAGFVARERIPILHYPHRDPMQMQQRYKLRASMKRFGSPAGPHWACDDWRNDLIICEGDPANSFEQANVEEGLASVPDHTSGELMLWRSNTELPRVHYLNHLKPQPIRFLRFALNKWLLPVADRLQEGFNSDWKPEPISQAGEEVTGIATSWKKKRIGQHAFRGLMVVRDEDDIIEQCLNHLLEWIDSVYVLDLGSTDETWNIVREIASRDKRVVPVQSAPFVFNNSLRGFVFEKYRAGFKDGDWILRLDADEFYHVSPRSFVRDRLLRGETCIHLGWYFFRLSSVELEDYETGRVDVLADRARPIEERRRFFKVTSHTEPRMFRYRPAMKWSPSASFPHHAGYVARERIPIRHYPHRDPLQMDRRYHLRSEMVRLKAASFPQWSLEDWRKDVIQYDPVTRFAMEQTTRGEGLSATRGHTDGPLYEWKQGEELLPLPRIDEGSFGPRQAVQWIIHPALLPLLDRVRRGWPQGYEPPLLKNSKR